MCPGCSRSHREQPGIAHCEYCTRQFKFLRRLLAKARPVVDPEGSDLKLVAVMLRHYCASYAPERLAECDRIVSYITTEETSNE